MNKYIALTTLGCLSLGLAACEEPRPTSDQVQRQQQEALSQQGNMVVGMPAITKFAEKRILKDIIELRDKTPNTYTYLAGEMNGTIGQKVCDSIGYGISGATQYTNPDRVAYGGNGNLTTIPQADPNGLFSPASTEGTWVLCKVPGSDKVEPQYLEPRIIVLTYPKENLK